MLKENLEQKNNTSNKGITLIALIITIVVMLILVAVTLDIAIGENGLVNKAKTASEATEREVDRELLLTAAIGAMGNDGKVNLSAMVLPEGFTGSNGTYTSSNGNTFTVSENGDIIYAGGSDSEDGTETVDLNGKYYYDLGAKTMYYEIINNNTMVVIEDGQENMRMPLEIDYDEKNIAVTYEYEDDSSNEMITDIMLFGYDFVIENGEVVNKYIFFKEMRTSNFISKREWI